MTLPQQGKITRILNILLVTQDAGAAKRRHDTIEHRVSKLKDICRLQHGTIAIDVSIKGNSVGSADIDCTDGEVGNWGCTVTAQNMLCNYDEPRSKSSPNWRSGSGRLSRG